MLFGNSSLFRAFVMVALVVSITSVRADQRTKPRSTPQKPQPAPAVASFYEVYEQSILDLQDAMAAGRWDEIEATAREFAAAYQSASSDRP